MNQELHADALGITNLLNQLAKWKKQCSDVQPELRVLAQYGTEEVFGDKAKHKTDNEFRSFCQRHEQELADLVEAISLMEKSLIRIRDRSRLMDRFF
jgi:hypothetical protein